MNFTRKFQQTIKSFFRFLHLFNLNLFFKRIFDITSRIMQFLKSFFNNLLNIIHQLLPNLNSLNNSLLINKILLTKTLLILRLHILIQNIHLSQMIRLPHLKPLQNLQQRLPLILRKVKQILHRQNTNRTHHLLRTIILQTTQQKIRQIRVQRQLRHLLPMRRQLLLSIQSPQLLKNLNRAFQILSIRLIQKVKIRNTINPYSLHLQYNS